MNYSPIIIVAGEPNSIFFEIFFKTLKKKKFSSPIILIASLKLINLQMKKLNFKKKIKLINIKNIKLNSLDNKTINLINVEYNPQKAFEKISKESNLYIKNCFTIAFNLLKKGSTCKLINGPISKKNFLDKKYLGITEYISHKFSVKNNAMLIFNKKLAVCPITTHLPLKLVAKNINKKIINEKVKLINLFYKKKFNLKPKIAVLGLNPHCESVLNFNEDDRIIKPAIKNLIKSGYNISGPHSADTIFLRKNRKKFNVIIGMYHDQVLTPMKTLFEYDAINITLGLPFLRISPDHGPNVTMLGKNLSNPLSLFKALEFLDKN